jgi:beta-mannanase
LRKLFLALGLTLITTLLFTASAAAHHRCGHDRPTPGACPPPEPAPAPAPAPAPSPTPPPPPSGSGGIVQGYAPQDGVSASSIDAYAALVGQAPGIVMWYQWWGNQSSVPTGSIDAVKAKGAQALVTWEPWAGKNPDPVYKLSEIAAGKHDAYITSYARQAASYGKTFYLRYAHEQNMVQNYPWVTGPGNANGNTEADYIAAWRHVHDIFQREGATNVRWVWSPNIKDAWGSPNPLANTYPGDAYVDWMGMDGYNWGSTVSWSRWKPFSEVFGETYADITTVSGKPLMIAETGSCEQGGDKAAYIKDMLETQIPNNFPQIKAFVWFQYNKECDWRVNSSTAAQAAFKAGISSGSYGGTLP